MQDAVVLLSVTQCGAFGCERQRGDVDRIYAGAVQADDVEGRSGGSVVGFVLEAWKLEVPDRRADRAQGGTEGRFDFAVQFGEMQLWGGGGLWERGEKREGLLLLS